MARIHALLPFLISSLTLGGIASHSSPCESTLSCAELSAEQEHRARSLLQLTKEQQAVELHAHTTLEGSKVQWQRLESSLLAKDQHSRVTNTRDQHSKVRSAKKAKSNQEPDAANNAANDELGFEGPSTPSSPSSDARAITFITLYDPFFETNLGTSALWKQRETLAHEWKLINNTENEGISKLYAQAQGEAVHDLQVFLHSDIVLPDEFYENFMEKLKKIEELDPNWGTLGTACAIHNESFFDIVSSITDTFSTYTSGVDSIEVSSCDESLMVLRKGSPQFDAELPGFDLYGLDIALSARKAGQKNYLLNVPLKHKTIGVDGGPYSAAEMTDKVHGDDYEARVNETATYFQNKWCKEGYLPIRGTAFLVECEKWTTMFR